MTTEQAARLQCYREMIWDVSTRLIRLKNELDAPEEASALMDLDSELCIVSARMGQLSTCEVTK